MDAVGLKSILLFTLPFMILSRIGMWMMFKKAGRTPWLALIPFVSWYMWIKIVNRPVWWLAMLLIPAVNVVVWYTLTIDMLKSFGRFKFRDHVMGILFPFGFFPYIGFKKEAVYIGPNNTEAFKKQYESGKRNVKREWADAIFFAVVVAYLIRGFFIEPFKIPTSSMEKSLLVGDFLFVSKINYGARIPMTPIAIPFAHQDLFGVQAYSEIVELPYLRLPGFQKIKRNDAIVFNVPWDMLDATKRPADKMQNYVKRCVALPGDLLEIKEGQLYINGQPSENPKDFQHNYLVKFKDAFPDENILIDNFDIYDYRYIENSTDKVMSVALTEEKAAAFKEAFEIDTMFQIKASKNNDINMEIPQRGAYNFPINYIIQMKSADKLLTKEEYNRIGIIFAITMQESPKSYYVCMDKSKVTYSNYHSISAIDTILAVPSLSKSFPLFKNTSPLTPNAPELFKWNKDNFGPLYLPKAGDVIKLDERNYNLYQRAIREYEGNADLEWAHGRAYINQKPIDSYTFKMNYYWMMGDNRDNSLDSRFWGYVPEDHIVGKPLFVFISFKYKNDVPEYGAEEGVDYNKFLKVRWNRTFKGID